MGYVNLVVIAGFIDDRFEPELKYTKSGVPVLNVNLVTVENEGENNEREETHSVSIWDKDALKFEERYHDISKDPLDFVKVVGKMKHKTQNKRVWKDNVCFELKIPRVEIIATSVEFLDDIE